MLLLLFAQSTLKCLMEGYHECAGGRYGGTALGNGVSPFDRTYEAGTTVTITAPATSGQNKFDSWDGCTLAITETCTVNMSADTIINAVYELPPS